MFEITDKLKVNEKLFMSPNLAEKLSYEDRCALGIHVWDGYNRDRESRMQWEKRTQNAMDLAMQVSREKTFPWPGASNVAFPLVTIATLQFHSRAYPSIINGSSIVQYKVNGPDEDGSQDERARRIGEHMSYQILEESQTWEEQHDRLLINIPIVGCAFTKTYYSGVKQTNESELVLAQDLVMDYYAKSVEDCSRKTHVMNCYRNDIHEKIMTGVYCDVREEGWYMSQAKPIQDQSTYREDTRSGLHESSMDTDAPYTILEQHLWLDLDLDGYKEPYICTIEASSKCVLRLVARFDDEKQISRNAKGDIIRIKPTEYFTKYGFIPSPDGGIYDIGFGVLLGPLNESVNSILNQLVDAGTMANTAGGFLGRGAKIRGGTYTFAPLEWKRVDSTGDDLKKSIFPLPVREPSNVLFQLLSLLIDYTNRVSGSTDTLSGINPGQNTKSGTMDSMVEQGMKIYNAIYKRVWRCMKEEFKKLYELNSTYLPNFKAFGDQGAAILKADYHGDSSRIFPVADPNITSDRSRMQKATALKQASMSTHGYDLERVERYYLQALQIDGADLMYPGPKKMPPPTNPKIAIEQLKMQAKQMQLQADMQKFAAQMQEDRRINNAKIMQLEAQAAKFVEEAGGVKSGQQIAAFEAAIGALKAHDDSMKGHAELLMKAMETAHENADGERMGGMATAPSHGSPKAPDGAMEG